MCPSDKDPDMSYQEVFDAFVDTKVFLPDAGHTSHSSTVEDTGNYSKLANKIHPADTSPMPSWDDPEAERDGPWQRALQYSRNRPYSPRSNSRIKCSAHPYSRGEAALSDSDLHDSKPSLLLEEPLSPIYSPPISPIPLPPALQAPRVSSRCCHPVVRRKPSGILKPSKRGSAPSLSIRTPASRPPPSEAWAKRIEAAAETFDMSVLNYKPSDTPPPSSVLDTDDDQSNTYAFDSQFAQDISMNSMSSSLDPYYRPDSTPHSSPTANDTQSHYFDYPESPLRHWSHDSLNSGYQNTSHESSGAGWDLAPADLGFSLAGASDENPGSTYGAENDFSRDLYQDPSTPSLTLEASSLDTAPPGMMYDLPAGTNVTFAAPDSTTLSPITTGTPRQVYFSPPTPNGSPQEGFSSIDPIYAGTPDRQSEAPSRRSASPSPLPRSIRRVGRLSTPSHRGSPTPQPSPFNPGSPLAHHNKYATITSPRPGSPRTPRARTVGSMHSASIASISSANSSSIYSLNTAAHSSNASIAGASSTTSLSVGSPATQSRDGTPFGGLFSPYMGTASLPSTALDISSFVNYTPYDRTKILTGVAPSGSSKTKARREKEAAERRKRMRDAATRAILEAGGDVSALEREGILEYE